MFWCSGPRTLPPVLGAATTGTFALGSSLADVAGAAQSCLAVIWPNLLIDQTASKSWSHLFQARPLNFHAFQDALAFHHDLLLNQISWSQSQQTIAYRAGTFSLLNQSLPHLSNETIELAILAVLVLASNEL